MWLEAAQVVNPLLVRCWLFERDNAGAARVQVLREALYCAALASRVSALKYDQQALSGCFDRLLQLQ